MPHHRDRHVVYAPREDREKSSYCISALSTYAVDTLLVMTPARGANGLDESIVLTGFEGSCYSCASNISYMLSQSVFQNSQLAAIEFILIHRGGQCMG
jgi:hypothetical protein